MTETPIKTSPKRRVALPDKRRLASGRLKSRVSEFLEGMANVNLQIIPKPSPGLIEVLDEAIAKLEKAKASHPSDVAEIDEVISYYSTLKNPPPTALDAWISTESVKKSDGGVPSSEGKSSDKRRFNPLHARVIVPKVVRSTEYEGSAIGTDVQLNTENPLKTRLELLEKFAIANSGIGVANYAMSLFPELKVGEIEETSGLFISALPNEAPATWKEDKLPGDTPPAFVQRVYGEWLGKGLDRATVRRLDPPLGQALDNWLRKNDMPPELDLPTAKERAAREIEALKAHAGDRDVNEVLGTFTAREAGRIRSNISRHERRK